MTAAVPANTFAKIFDRARSARVAEGLAIAVAVSLPWSTSATGILLVLWLAAFVPTLSLAEIRRELANPAAGLPVVLWAVVLLGTLWSDAGLAERLHAIRGYQKLLLIPLFMIQFRRSDKGIFVLGGFLASCTALLGVSWILHIFPIRPTYVPLPGVPVKDYIIQGTEFMLCAFALGHLAIDAWRKDRRMICIALSILAFVFLANVAFVAIGRTGLVAFPVLLALFAVQRFGWKGTVTIFALGSLLAAVAWTSSPFLRMRGAASVLEEIHKYRQDNVGTSSGYRLEFWKKSAGFVAAAPIVGHGAGSIEPLFASVATGGNGISAAVTGNPHNLTLEIGIQFGLLGVSVLYAMWIAQILLFSRGGLPAWLGLGVVAQTIVGSLFLAYVTDFSLGWIYVVAAGVLGGMVQAHGGEAAGASARSKARLGGA